MFYKSFHENIYKQSASSSFYSGVEQLGVLGDQKTFWTEWLISISWVTLRSVVQIHSPLFLFIKKGVLGVRMTGKKYSCILFDMDATLIQTSDEYIDFIFQRVFDELGLKGDLELKKRLWYDYKRSSILKEFYDDANKFWSALHKHQKQTIEIRKNDISIYGPNDLRTLGCLKNRLNLKLGIVSGSSEELLDISVKELGKDKFDYITHVYNNHRTKTGGILHCMEKLKADKKETLYIGNDDGDVIAAYEAGVDTGLIRRTELEEYRYFAPKLKADHEFKELSDILALF